MNATRALERSTANGIARLQRLRNEQKHGQPRPNRWAAELADIGRALTWDGETVEIALRNGDDVPDDQLSA